MEGPDANAPLERRIAELTAELEDARRELQALCYSVSHDLRAPLRAIGGFSALLGERIGARLDPEEADFLQRIRRAADRMSALIDGMLQLARLSTQPLARGRVDLGALARAAADELQRESPGRSAQWSIASGLWAEADAALMRTAMRSLVDNAWKFTSRVSSPRIDVGVERINGEAVFHVRDNGAGFDMSFSDRLFDTFHRMHAEHEFPGTGIGLATVKRIIARHGGKIWAQARPGQGAVFYFTLPADAGGHGNAT